MPGVGEATLVAGAGDAVSIVTVDTVGAAGTDGNDRPLVISVEVAAVGGA